MNVRIRRILTCLHSLSSNFDFFVKIKHNNCTIVLNFIIERIGFLNNIRIVFSFEIFFNIYIYMTEEDFVFCHNVFNIIRIVDQFLLFVRLQARIQRSIRNVLTHQLLY